MDKGNALEPIAIKLYKEKTGMVANDIGFILNPARDEIGLSPDFVSIDVKTAAEFKCPK